LIHPDLPAFLRFHWLHSFLHCLLSSLLFFHSLFSLSFTFYLFSSVVHPRLVLLFDLNSKKKKKEKERNFFFLQQQKKVAMLSGDPSYELDDVHIGGVSDRVGEYEASSLLPGNVVNETRLPPQRSARRSIHDVFVFA